MEKGHIGKVCLAAGCSLVIGVAYALSNSDLKSQVTHSLLGIVPHSSHPSKSLYIFSVIAGSVLVIIGTILSMGLPTPLIASHIYHRRNSYFEKLTKNEKLSQVSELSHFEPSPELRLAAQKLNLPRPTFAGLKS
eukprot:Gregarina_sp_Pseudo_9__3573@NODE_3733_length_572_cov_34_144465_g3417_i0_p1_GENE_NODE_3733_length_572_cov_34_144465_g3417_i0NODE_3733_length_572_cov_34_144465_g3417_i0_p1_ORF_typecomplete_len135_score6_35_NODE_3733_length_572_cov_34_144465_g3417_i029433